MTALAACWGFDAARADADLGAMLAAQRIYGGDGVAMRRSGDAMLGRSLARLLPEDDHDRGPVLGERWLVAADVRLDDRQDLGRALDWPDGRLATTSDAALIAAALERWGEAAIDRLRGGFALVAWHAVDARLLLARDALGERPLHYHLGQGFAAVASMPAGLHALEDIPCAADRRASADFVALLPETGDDSFYAGIRRVRPGHHVTITRAGARSERWWHPAPRPLRLRTAADHAEGLREQLDRAVGRRLRRADGGVAAQLSGGLDSAAVAATAARLLAPEPLHAFTAVPSRAMPSPPHGMADESPLARATAALHPGMRWSPITAGATPPSDLLDRQFRLFQRPVLNPSNATWGEAINDAARAAGARVLLTGQMGNLTLSHDGLSLLPALFAGGRWWALARLAARVRRRTGRRWRGLAALTLGPFLPGAWWMRLTGEAPLSDYSALRPEAFDTLGVAVRGVERGADAAERPRADGTAARLWALERVDMGVYNKGTLAGWGLDLRDPTADRDLVEWTLSVPEEQFILDGEPRSLARRAFADRLPPEVLREQRRGVQGADWQLGFLADRRGLRAELESIARAPDAHALLDADALLADLAAADAVPEEAWNTPEMQARYRHRLLRAVAAGHFLRKVARTN